MTIASEWPVPWRVDVLDRLLDRVDDRDRQLQAEVLGVPVLRRSPAPTSTSPAAARARSSPTSSTPAAARSASAAGAKRVGDRGVDQQRLGRVADARAAASLALKAIRRAISRSASAWT